MKTTYKVFLISLIFFISSGHVFGEKVEDIIAKHIEAHGGTDNWNNIKSLKITGDFTSYSETFPFTMIKTDANKYYCHYTFGMHEVTDGNNGSFCWTDNPWFELPFPRKLNNTESYLIEQKQEFCTPFFNYESRGFKVELLGKEKVDGMEMFKIKLTKKKNQIETWYLNTKTYLEYKLESNWSDFGRPSPAETYFDEFNKIGNITMPFYVETSFGTRHRVTEIQNVEINPQLDMTIFEMPKSNEINKLKSLEGKWSVIVEALGRRGFFKADSTTSCIKYASSGNLLKEVIEYEAFYKFKLNLKYTYNGNTQKYRVSTFNDFNSELNILEGVLKENTLTVDNTGVDFKGVSEENKEFTRIEIKDIKPEGFIIEISSSRDKGETWNVHQKMNYSRL
jgi:hypothetical protein